jgi:hypothetical protein
MDAASLSRNIWFVILSEEEFATAKSSQSKDRYLARVPGVGVLRLRVSARSERTHYAQDDRDHKMDWV